MKRVLPWLALALAALAASPLPFVDNVIAQTLPAEPPQTGVVLTKLFPPVYPPLARQARINGEVRVQVSIKQDGRVEAAEVVSGHPILKEAALESAQKSTFECRGCSGAVTTYSLTFEFELRDDGDCCDGWSRMPKVNQIQDHITIEAPNICTCDPRATIRKHRSPKCLYLWKCGVSWE